MSLKHNDCSEKGTLNTTQIEKHLTSLHPDGSVFEIRILGAQVDGRGCTVSGCFNNPQNAVAELEMFCSQHACKGVYVTLNPCQDEPPLMLNQLLPTSQATKDADILCRRNLLLDFDPKRKSGVSSTDAELEMAGELRDQVISYLESMGFAPPLQLLSGNGYHAIYALGSDVTDDQVKKLLQYVSRRFSNEQVAIDKQVHNAARITKLAGTWACKGEDEPARPHRMAMLESENWERCEVTAEQIDAVITALAPEDREHDGSHASPESLHTREYALSIIEPIAAGCAFMRHVRDDAVELGEPEWFHGLSVLARCDDGESLCHEWSRPHPGYSESETENKRLHVLNNGGPVTCKTVADQLGFEGCASCVHRGKITSPIQLGRQDEPTHPYRETSHGLVMQKGEDADPLTNFTARIITEVTMDDGVTRTKFFRIKVKCRNKEWTVDIPADEFDEGKWVTGQLGSLPVVHAYKKSHAMNAIKLLSAERKEKTIYTHTGWRKILDQWYYLLPDGAMGAEGFHPDIETQLPKALACLDIQPPEADCDLVKAIRASLDLMKTASAKIMVPLLCAVYRGVLGDNSACVFISGLTGSYKSTLGALMMSHFGSGYCDPRNIPARFAATENALPHLAHIFRDLLMVVDEFTPVGGKRHVDSMHLAFDRLARATADRQMRSRMQAGSNDLRDEKPPYALPVCIGEHMPTRSSGIARTWLVDLTRSEIDLEQLTMAQRYGSDGQLSQAMGGYLKWLASRIGEIQKQMAPRSREIGISLQLNGHKRTPELAGTLLFGLETFLQFAVDAQAIPDEERQRYWDLAIAAMKKEAAYQAEAVDETDNFNCTIELLRSAIATNVAYLEVGNGVHPPLDMLGYRSAMEPGQHKVGWADHENIYLDANAVARVVRKMAGDEINTCSPMELGRELNKRGLLASKEKGRGNKTRCPIGNHREPCLHIKLVTLFPSYVAGQSGPQVWRDYGRG